MPQPPNIRRALTPRSGWRLSRTNSTNSLPGAISFARFARIAVVTTVMPDARAGATRTRVQSTGPHRPGRAPWQTVRSAARRGVGSAQDAVEPVEVVDHAPGAAARLDPALPRLKAVHVVARVDVVRAQLGHVDRDHLEAIHGQRDVTHIAVLQVLLEVGEDQDGLAAGILLVQVLDRLQHAAGDV